MTITPDQARELLDGATPGPWRSEYDNEIIEADTSTVLYNTDGAVGWGHNIEHDVPLASAAPDLAQTIAGMRWEYAVEHEHSPGSWHLVTEWGPEENPYQPGYGPGDDERVVRRLVGPVEVIDGE